MFFYERVNRIKSWDYNPIFDTDFESLVRYDRFPSLLYGPGATFLEIGLWYGGAASSFIPIFSVHIISIFLFRQNCFLMFVWGTFFDIKAIFFGKNRCFR